MGDNMSAKEKKKVSISIIFLFLIIILFSIIYLKFISNKETYATENDVNKNVLKVSQAKQVDIEEIINANQKENYNKDEIYERQEELEYITKYKYSDEIYIGETRIAQQGRNGIQTITMKKSYSDNGKLISDEQIGCRVTKSSLDKIIEIGTKKYVEPAKTNVDNETLYFDMPLNKPSGFTIEQFKTALTDNKDVNKIFEQNSDYFYYIEKEYNVNGIFVAAIGIHESAWGTSRLAKNKYNLFGYGAYDSNPYNGAYTFSSYSESIDLLARVLTKYYLNPKGAIVFDGQVATGKYYSGNTISSVNKKYATDKNWANAVYKYMQYLYGKI